MRFDIFERINLPDELGGIKKLEGIRLATMVSAEQMGDKVRMFGVLILTGTYIDLDGDREQIEHTIPVEIMIPSDRVKRIEDLATAFESSKVAILSAKTIEVTGVLRLFGVEHAVLPQAIVPTESAQASAGGRIGGSYE